MTFTDPNFIITDKWNVVEKKDMLTLRRYKGKESVVTIPDGVEVIDNYVFADDIEPNDTITKIIIPDSVSRISPHAFYYCNALKEINFPQKMTNFEVEFEKCPSVEEIWIPESVQRIGDLKCTDVVKAVHVGQNITWVNFTDFSWETNKSFGKRKKHLIETLLQNPAYKIIDGFMVNFPYKTVLFRADGSQKEMKIPDGMETVRNGTFYELRMPEDMLPIEKVVIPASVKEIKNLAFHCCYSLKEVRYEGKSSELKLGEVPFYMCAGFHHDGREIICKDRPKQTTRKGKTASWDMIRRMIIIDEMIRTKSFPKLTDFLDVCMKNVTSASIPSLNRDISMMRLDLCAPIEYDTVEKGYYYSSPFTLDFRRLRLW